MVLLLIGDAVRRKWRLIVFAVWQLYMLTTAMRGLLPAADPMAGVLMGAMFLAMTAGSMLQSREIYQLPIPRRALWLARWWLATAGAVLVAELAAFLAAQTAFPSVVFAVCAFLYCGCAMALVSTPWGRWLDKPLVLHPVNLEVILTMASVCLAMIVPLAVAFFFARYLPHTFAAIDVQSTIVLLAMAAISARGYLYQPALEARPSLRAPERLAPERPAVARPTRFADRLTGSRLSLWEVSRAYFGTYALVLVSGIACWWVASFFWAVPPLATVLGDVDMLPFASPTAHVTEAMTVGALFITASMLDALLMPDVRSLRALPLSGMQLGCIPMVLGLVSASMLWLVFFAVHLVVLQTPPVSFRLDLFAAFAALTALTHTLRITLPGHPVFKSTLGVALLGILWLVGEYFDTFRADIVQPLMLAGGLATLAASFVLMRHAVTRGSGIYRRPLMPVRFGN